RASLPSRAQTPGNDPPARPTRYQDDVAAALKVKETRAWCGRRRRAGSGGWRSALAGGGRRRVGRVRRGFVVCRPREGGHDGESLRPGRRRVLCARAGDHNYYACVQATLVLWLAAENGVCGTPISFRCHEFFL